NRPAVSAFGQTGHRADMALGLSLTRIRAQAGSKSRSTAVSGHTGVLSLGRKPRRGQRRPFDDSERFRTIQDFPNDLPAALRQVGRAENRAHGSVGGTDSA